MAFSHSIDFCKVTHRFLSISSFYIAILNSTMSTINAHFVNLPTNDNVCNQCIQTPFRQLTLPFTCSAINHNRNACILMQRQKNLSASINTFRCYVAQIEYIPLHTIETCNPIWFQPLRCGKLSEMTTLALCFPRLRSYVAFVTSST